MVSAFLLLSFAGFLVVPFLVHCIARWVAWELSE